MFPVTKRRHNAQSGARQWSPLSGCGKLLVTSRFMDDDLLPTNMRSFHSLSTAAKGVA